MASRISQNQIRALLQLYRRPYLVRSISTSWCNFRNDASATTTMKYDIRPQIHPSTTRSVHTSLALNGTYSVKMPSLSPTMTEGTIVKWLKKEGDPIAAGDVLCEIQTDKAVVSMEYDEDGILAKILVPENTADIKVGTLIALAVDEGDDWQNVEVPADAGAPPPSTPAPEAATPSPPSPAAAAPASTGTHKPGSDRLVGPAVKNYLRKYGLEASKVPASGPHGTVTKGDVLNHVLANKIEPVSLDASPPQGSSAAGRPAKKPKAKGHAGPATYVDVEITNMRRTIAKRLLQSKSTIPHAYGTAKCNVKNLVAFRKKLTATGVKVSVNDLIIKCVSNALSLNPALNCVWEGSQLKQQGQVDISVAVATPNGLITPIVTNVGSRDVVSISSAVRVLAAKARDGKLQPHEFMGGSFSISNLGMFGIHSFSAIINPPQCAILAVGGTSLELDENGGSLSTVKLMLSYDASAIMEDDALKFLAVLRNEIENVNEISMGIYNLEARSDELLAAAQ